MFLLQAPAVFSLGRWYQLEPPPPSPVCFQSLPVKFSHFEEKSPAGWNSWVWKKVKACAVLNGAELSFMTTNQSLKSAFQRRSFVLLLRGLQKLVNFCVLVVGFIYLVVELRSTCTIWVWDQKALCFLHFICLLWFYFADRTGNVLGGS